MKILLKDNSLLLHAARTGLKNACRDCVSYAESIEADIIDPETHKLIKKYNIDKNELILVETTPLAYVKIRANDLPESDARRLCLLKSILKGKRIYVSRLLMKDGRFEFSYPSQVGFEIEAPNCITLQSINNKLQKNRASASSGATHFKSVNRYLDKINRDAVNGLVESARRDFEFVFHFNSEMFYNNLTAKGLEFSKETVSGIYEDRKYAKILDLFDARERMGFISLYAITFCKLTLDDLYSVEGIFLLEPNRERDAKKRRAGQDVFNLVFSENRAEIQKRAVYMGKALMALPLPEVDPGINSLIKKNYTLYCGLADIGLAFSRLILSADNTLDDAVKTARRLSYYKTLDNLCAEILRTEKDYTSSAVYKRASAFADAVRGKKTAGELDFDLNMS